MAIETCHQQLGLKVKALREMLGWSQQELADRIKQERSSVANMETGRQRFLLQTVEQLAMAFSTTPKNLMKGIWW